MHKRVIFGREDSSKWVVKQKNRENVETLLESGASFIIATAHFQRFAFLATALVDVTPGNLVQVALPAPDRIKSIKDARNRLAKSTLTRFLYDIRVGLQYRAMNEALVIARNEDVEFAWVLPDASAAQRLYKKLVEKGNIINVHVDAPWTENSNGTYSRSFAGVQRRPFATGAAQLSKLAQCPIISCVYWMNADGSIVLEWGSPIRDVDNEKEIMDRLINTFETAIGERPTQYSLNMGSERCWSPALHIWQD
jgi:lauroyl/myristoyl acyltransferase